MARPFDHVLRLPGAQPEDVALAIAAEFEQVDPAAAHERLDGELDRSIHALELATLLPLAGPLRARIDVSLAGIRAQLN